MKAKLILDLISKEIDWSKGNRSNVNSIFLEGYLAGLRGAQLLINAQEKLDKEEKAEIS